MITTKARILKEGLFSVDTEKGKISKKIIGKWQQIDKGTHRNQLLITDHSVEDVTELFMQSLSKGKSWK